MHVILSTSSPFPSHTDSRLLRLSPWVLKMAWCLTRQCWRASSCLWAVRSRPFPPPPLTLPPVPCLSWPWLCRLLEVRRKKKWFLFFFSKNLAPLVILHSCQIVLPIFRQKVVTHIYIYYAIEITCSWNVEHLLGKAWALFLCQILSRSSK